MDEAVHLLKVTVVQGKQLVVRDFRTSDPYVVIKLGNQVLKTKVINNCLNPVWNEELTFTISEPNAGALNLEVFDKDMFKSDDKMGKAHLSLHEIKSAARMKHVLKISAGETKIRTIIPNSDNCLVRESVISCRDGELVQEVWLRLDQVESGEIELKLKLVDHRSSPLTPAP